MANCGDDKDNKTLFADFESSLRIVVVLLIQFVANIAAFDTN